MNPVIGLDISKGKSDGQVFLDKGQPFGHPFCFQHNQDGLMQLLDIITKVQNRAEKAPIVILESTGHYYQAVIQYLEEHGILFLVVNPLISHQAKKSSLRKVKQIRLMPFGYVNCITKRKLKTINNVAFNN